MRLFFILRGSNLWYHWKLRKYLVKLQVHKNKNSPSERISTNCELLLLRFLMYVNDYGTQWRIVRATLTMPAITDGWSWIRAATVCGCAALYCTVMCFVDFLSGAGYLPNFVLTQAVLWLTLIYTLMTSEATYTANAYRQTTDKLMFKSVISTVRWIRK